MRECASNDECFGSQQPERYQWTDEARTTAPSEKSGS